MKEHFSTYGDLSSVELEESKLQKINDKSVQSDVSALISFTTRRSAERAFLNGKCGQDHNLQFMWLASSNSGREDGSAGIPSASSNTPSEANAHVQPDRDGTSSQSQKSEASGCSEPENLTKESGAESVEKGGSAGIPSASSNTPSEANAPVQPDRDGTSIRSQKSEASGCSGPENLTKGSGAESVEKGCSAGNPSASSDTPSEANTHVQPDRDAISIHSQKSDTSGCSEPKNLTEESDAESVEKGEDFQPVTTLVSSENNAS